APPRRRTTGTAGTTYEELNWGPAMPGLFRRPPQPQQRRPQQIVQGAAETNAQAENAAGTGTAYGATISLAPTAGLSSGAGTALDAAASLQVAAGNAAGTGVASNAAISLAPTAGIATGTGAALDAAGAAATS